MNEQLPIELKASSLDFTARKAWSKYDAVTITQGGIRITAERAVASGLDFEDSNWEFSGMSESRRPSRRSRATRRDVRFAGGEIQSAAVTGSPATFEQRRKEGACAGPRKPHRL